jgi:DNA-binding transcriptional regulator of glucitol operon
LPINVKSPNNISKWQMEFNSAFKGLMQLGFEPGAVVGKLVYKLEIGSYMQKE